MFYVCAVILEEETGIHFFLNLPSWILQISFINEKVEIIHDNEDIQPKNIKSVFF